MLAPSDKYPNVAFNITPILQGKGVCLIEVSPGLPSGQCSALCFHSSPTDSILPALPVLVCTQDRQLLMHQVAGEEVPCV